MSKTLTILLLLFSLLSADAQQTIGLFQNDPTAFNGYTLFTPQGAPSTYLIDNCGNLVNEWTSSFAPGLSVYFLKTGELLRTAMVVGSGTFNGGGIGGRVERYDWEGNLNWSFNFADSLMHQHHDIEPLPNGNFLLVAWEYKTASEAIAQGRDPSTLSNSLWPDHIIEVAPVGTDQANVVWEWHLWDHLVQDFDSSKSNYGAVAAHPELVDINYIAGGGFGGNGADWNHVNGIDYHEGLDQIVLSSLHFDEIWVIDHSTTTAEAAGHSGGVYGKGGDLLYRYGNPLAYRRGNLSDRIFNGQHNPTWIPAGHPHAGKIMVFNNQGPGGPSSAVDIINPPEDSPGFYTDPGSGSFGPPTYDWRYTASDFFATNVSGATGQPNGNVLICEGTTGRIFEVDPNQDIVWEYMNPAGIFGPLTQGNSPGLNGLFRAEKYAPDFQGFAGKDLTPGGPIELNPLPSNCVNYVDSGLLSSQEGLEPLLKLDEIQFANPVRDVLKIRWNGVKFARATAVSVLGKIHAVIDLHPGSIELDVSYWSNGCYILNVYSDQYAIPRSYKIIKQSNE